MPHDIRITKKLSATPDEVFDAWTDVKSVRQWMVPQSSWHAEAKIDPRVGGKFKIDMIGEGKTYPHEGEYLRIERPRLIEFTWISQGTNQQRTVVTVELRPVGDETELTLTHKMFPTKEAANDHRQGWTAIVDHLADVLAKARK